MKYILIALLTILVAIPSLANETEISAKARAISRLKAEMHYTRLRHPGFDHYRQVVFRYMAKQPDMLVEEAYCAVTREPTDLCDEVLKMTPQEERSAIPTEAVPYLLEQENGSFVKVIDDKTGAPVFDAAGVKYTAFGLVGDSNQSVPMPPDKRRRDRIDDMLLGGTLLGPAHHDAYGPDLHSDATGRPFTYRTSDGQKTFGPVTPNGYGIGVHTDQFGRPVYAVPQH